MPSTHFGLRIWSIKCRMMSILLSKYCPSTEADLSPSCSMNLSPTFQTSINLSLFFISATYIVYPKVYWEMLPWILHGMLMRLSLVQREGLAIKSFGTWVISRSKISKPKSIYIFYIFYIFACFAKPSSWKVLIVSTVLNNVFFKVTLLLNQHFIIERKLYHPLKGYSAGLIRF